LSEVGILVIDDDLATQRALKNVLDAEGWRVRVVPHARHALTELANNPWNLVIINVALTDLRGPLFAILKELSQTEQAEPPAEATDGAPAVAKTAPLIGEEAEAEPPPARKRIRVLFLVPALSVRAAQPVLEREGLPYSLKPYHLHDFLEKVSELLEEAGAIETPIRSMRDFSARKKRIVARRSARDSRRGAMFATREDYQMTEEEMVEFERQEEEDRKKREKERLERQHLG
jgi:PleD family two-component response regulator